MKTRKIRRSNSNKKERSSSGRSRGKKPLDEVVISLGGSLIIPTKIDHKFLKEFKSVLQKHYKTHKFIIVCGGGVIARKYIAGLKKAGATQREQADAGIRATRMNAKFMMQYFGKAQANDTLPLNIKSVINNIPKNNVVFCGALRYTPTTTSDGTAAKLAHHLKCPFINLTNVSGLYTADPKKYKTAKFIPEISHKDFSKLLISKIKTHKPGQHFILDGRAASLAYKHQIPTYIIKGPKNLDKLLKGKKFKGTKIS